jgi:hypothetical protein
MTKLTKRRFGRGPSGAVDPSQAIFLLAADFALADGTPLVGYVTPPSPRTITDLATTQPCIFVGEEIYSFWGGMLGIPAASRERFYSLLGKSPPAVFPITFRTRPGVAPTVAGAIPGFLKSSQSKTLVET